jgi:hypothetical protein
VISAYPFSLWVALLSLPPSLSIALTFYFALAPLLHGTPSEYLGALSLGKSIYGSPRELRLLFHWSRIVDAMGSKASSESFNPMVY